MLVNNRPSLQSYPAHSAAQPQAAATQPQTVVKYVLHKAEEEAADVVVAFSHIPVLRDLGYKLYGMFTKPKANTPALSNVGDLTPTIERGAQPTEAGFAQLKQQGVNTVINLRPEEQWEEPMVKAQGMKYVYMPLPAVGAPTNDQALQFLRTVTDPANGKVFFHCQHGADRTGAMAAAYRIAAQGWTADQAIAEMTEYNFHQGFEDEKLVFIRKFADYWKTLSPQAKAEILHISLNQTA